MFIAEGIEGIGITSADAAFAWSYDCTHNCCTIRFCGVEGVFCGDAFFTDIFVAIFGTAGFSKFGDGFRFQASSTSSINSHNVIHLSQKELSDRKITQRGKETAKAAKETAITVQERLFVQISAVMPDKRAQNSAV